MRNAFGESDIILLESAQPDKARKIWSRLVKSGKAVKTSMPLEPFARTLFGKETPGLDPELVNEARKFRKKMEWVVLLSVPLRYVPFFRRVMNMNMREGDGRFFKNAMKSKTKYDKLIGEYRSLLMANEILRHAEKNPGKKICAAFGYAHTNEIQGLFQILKSGKTF